MSVSDWMATTPSDWMEQAMPGWQGRYDQLLQAPPSELWSMMYAPFLGQAGGGPRMLVTTQPHPGRQERGHHRHHHDCDCGCHEGRHDHHRDHECRHCGHDSCECFCCVGDVDLVVYARVGEQRVVPVVVENERRREKEVKLELSDWTTRGGSAAPVRTVLLEPKALKLAPCSEQDVTLVVQVLPEQRDQGSEAPKEKPDAPKGKAAAPEEKGFGIGGSLGAVAAAAAGLDVSSRTQIPDVDECRVVTADLRLLGCDHRPIRIAVAILPRDCDPFRVGCGCTCC